MALKRVCQDCRMRVNSLVEMITPFEPVISPIHCKEPSTFLDVLMEKLSIKFK